MEALFVPFNLSIFHSSNYFFNPYACPYLIVGILLIFTGSYIFFQQRSSLLTAAYLSFSTSTGIWLIGDALGFLSKEYAIAYIWGRYFCWLGVIFITPGVYMFSVIWRDRSLKKRSAFVWTNFVIAGINYFICVSTPLVVKGMWSYPWGYYPRIGPFGSLFIIWFYFLMILSFRNFVTSYREEILPVRKKQCRLLIIAFMIAFLGSIEFIPNYGVAQYLYAFIPIFVFIVLVGYSIIQHRLMDIETAIHKTIGWILSNFILITPFMLIAHFLKTWLVTVNSVIFFGVVGGASLFFIFLLRVLQPTFNRVFQREQLNVEEIAGHFSEELIRLEGVSNLMSRMESIIKDTLYTRRIDIYIYNDKKKLFWCKNSDLASETKNSLSKDDCFLQWLSGNDRIVHKEHIDADPIYESIREDAFKYFDVQDTYVVVPLVVQKRLIGVMNLSKKANLKRYRGKDFYFLRIIKNQAAIALLNSLLYEDVEAQVKQRTRQLEEAQRQLVHAEKLATMGTLAGGVAHEINNPLTAILANAQMLLASDEIKDVSDRESLELIEDATKRCRSIVQKLMEYARKPLEAVRIARVDLVETLNKVLSFLKFQLEQEDITVTIKINDKGTYYVAANQNELEQVFTNIILNAKDAIKRVKKQGNIHISISEIHTKIVVAIKDDGIGMSTALLSKIFDPFFTTKDVGKGMGLGLAICQSIIERYGGTIQVESEPNKGATFTLQFPSATITLVSQQKKDTQKS